MNGIKGILPNQYHQSLPSGLPAFMQRSIRFFPDNGDGDGGGGGGGGGDGNGKTYTQSELDEIVSGIKNNIDSLRSEKNKVTSEVKHFKEMFESLGGEDGINRLKKLREQFADDELGKLLADGKTDEWFNIKTEAMRNSHEQAIESYKSQLLDAEKKAIAAVDKYNQNNLETALIGACSRKGIVDSAISDAILRGKSEFKYHPEHEHAVLLNSDGSVRYGKDGVHPMGVDEWLDLTVKTQTHWVPPSKGAGAGGSGGGAGAGDTTPDDVGKMSAAEYAAWREKNSASRKSFVP